MPYVVRAGVCSTAVAAVAAMDSWRHPAPGIRMHTHARGSAARSQRTKGRPAVRTSFADILDGSPPVFKLIQIKEKRESDDPNALGNSYVAATRARGVLRATTPYCGARGAIGAHGASPQPGHCRGLK